MPEITNATLTATLLDIIPGQPPTILIQKQTRSCGLLAAGQQTSANAFGRKRGFDLALQTRRLLAPLPNLGVHRAAMPQIVTQRRVNVGKVKYLLTMVSGVQPSR